MSAGTIAFAAPLGAPAGDGRIVVQRAMFTAGGALYRLGTWHDGEPIGPEPGPMMDADGLRRHGVASAPDMAAFPFALGETITFRPGGGALPAAGIVRGVSDAIGCGRSAFIGTRTADGWRGVWIDEVQVVRRSAAAA